MKLKVHNEEHPPEESIRRAQRRESPVKLQVSVPSVETRSLLVLLPLLGYTWLKKSGTDRQRLSVAEGCDACLQTTM